MHNSDRNHKVSFIAPYKELAVVAQTVRDKFDLNFSINVGNLPGCLDIVKRKIETGTDVVITRGGNALKIKEKFDIPVIEVEVNAVDIIMATRLC